MSANVSKLSGSEAYNLIYDDSISKMTVKDQDTMLKFMVNSVNVWTGMEGSTVLAVWGLIPPSILSDRAYLWLYVTEHMHEHQFIFIRHSQRAVAEMLAEYPVITGHTMVGNDKAIRWLRWLGAVFGEPQGLAIPFEIRAKHG